MLVKWVVFCLEESVATVREMLHTVVAADDPDASEKICQSRKDWRLPVRCRLTCEYTADHMPVDMKAKVARLGGVDPEAVSVVDQEQRLSMITNTSAKDLSNAPYIGCAVCEIYKNL